MMAEDSNAGARAGHKEHPGLKLVLELGPLLVFFFANSYGERLGKWFPVLAELGFEEVLTVAPLAGVPWSPCASFAYLRPDRERGDLRTSNRGAVVLTPGVEVDRSAISGTPPAKGIFSGIEGRGIETRLV